MLRAYPREFRRRFGPEMEETLVDRWRDGGGLRWAGRVAWDWAASAIRERMGEGDMEFAVERDGRGTFVPCFAMTADERPRGAAVAAGAAVSTVLFAGLVFAIQNARVVRWRAATEAVGWGGAPSAEASLKDDGGEGLARLMKETNALVLGGSTGKPRATTVELESGPVATIPRQRVVITQGPVAAVEGNEAWLKVPPAGANRVPRVEARVGNPVVARPGPEVARVPAVPPADVSGKWVGTIRMAGSRSLAVVLRQDEGGSVEGSVAVNGAFMTHALGKAAVRGNDVSFESEYGGQTLRFHLTAEGGRLTGYAESPGAVYGVRLRGPVVRFPKVLERVRPEYTEEGRRLRNQGTVVLMVTVDARGRARQARVLRALGNGLDEKAIDAVRRWRFRPGTERGRAVRMETKVEVEFRLR
jgi:TonB family protein